MKKSKVLILIVIMIIIIGIGIGVLYFTTDIFKTNQELFYKNLAQIQIKDENLINTIHSIYSRIDNESLSSTLNLNVMNIDNQQNILKLKSNQLKNSRLNQNYSDFTVSLGDNQLSTVKLLKDADTYAIGADNVLSKYLSVKKENLGELFNKIGISYADAATNVDINKLFKIEESTLENIKSRYFDVFNNCIDKTHYEKEKTTDGLQIISLSMTEQEFSNTIKTLLETLQNDEELLNLIANKLNMIQNNNINIEEIKSNIKEYIDKKFNENYSTEKDFLKISIIKNEKKIIKINFLTNYKEDLENKSYNVEVDISVPKQIKILDSNKNSVEYSYDVNNENISGKIYCEDNDKQSYQIECKISGYGTENLVLNCIAYLKTSEQNYQINIDSSIKFKEDIRIEKLTTENSAAIDNLSKKELEELIQAIQYRIISLYGNQIV